MENKKISLKAFKECSKSIISDSKDLLRDMFIDVLDQVYRGRTDYTRDNCIYEGKYYDHYIVVGFNQEKKSVCVKLAFLEHRSTSWNYDTDYRSPFYTSDNGDIEAFPCEIVINDTYDLDQTIKNLRREVDIYTTILYFNDNINLNVLALYENDEE